MKCPKCGSDISDKAIAKHLASKGGSKSRRTLSPKQARAMVAAREAKRKEKSNE